MSKLPKNFEKALIGVAGVAAVAFVAMGFMKSNAVSTDFAHSTATSGKDDPSIPEAEATARAATSLTTNLQLQQVEENGRKVDLFTGIPLYADKNNPNQPIDLIRGRQIHEGIANTWWNDTGADPSYANSPDRDDDKDGFSNRDEHDAKPKPTNPTDPKDFPALIDKLAYNADESTQWYVAFGLESGGQWAPKVVAVTPDKKRVENKVSAAAMINPGDVFFNNEKDLFRNRFKYIGIGKKTVVSPRTKAEEEVNVAEFEELKPNKKGLKYTSQYGLPETEFPKYAYYDRTAVVELKAVGSEGKTFKVEEGTTFALPPEAAEKKYLMKAITPEAIEVEYTDAAGQKQTKSIPKGAK